MVAGLLVGAIGLALVFLSNAQIAGVVLVVVGLALIGRERSAATAARAPRLPPAVPAGRRSRLDRGPLTRLEDVVPLPANEAWPRLPDPPTALAGGGGDDYVPVAERPYARTTCPTCGVELDPPPKAKRKCPGCQAAIYVKSGPDNRRYLMKDGELEAFEQLWNSQRESKYLERRARQEAAEIEWVEMLRTAGFAVGDEDLDVVGESHYHAALAGIRAALGSGDWEESRAIAALVAEPNNPHDRNAVGVYIHGAKVGHLDRYDAADYQRPIIRAGGTIYVQALIAGGRPTEVGEVGPIGVRLESIPGPRDIGR
jgi:hypothetical protein